MKQPWIQKINEFQHRAYSCIQTIVLGYNKQQAQACVKQYQKDYANIRGLTYQASVTDKEMKQLLVLKLTDIDTAQLKKLDFIQTLEDAVFDVHTAVVVYEQQGLTCSTKPAA